MKPELPSNVWMALKRCVETDAAVQLAYDKAVDVKDDGRFDREYLEADRADDSATHELGAAVWEWLSEAGIVDEIRKEMGK